MNLAYKTTMDDQSKLDEIDSRKFREVQSPLDRKMYDTKAWIHLKEDDYKWLYKMAKKAIQKEAEK